MSRIVKDQQFGGPWSLLKVETVGAYLESYNTALKDKPFPQRPYRRIYIDAFAGSGTFSYGRDVHSELLNQVFLAKVHAGSAQRAVSTIPPFHEVHLIESNPKSVEALQGIAAKRKKSGQATPAITIVEGDANVEVKRICASLNASTTRGVIFLDPYGASVEWSTLEAIAATKVLDLWYLFPLSGAYRNAPLDLDALTPDKRATLNRLLGTRDWEHEFYQKEPAQQSLFGLPAKSKSQRILNAGGIQTYVKRRLETLFQHVEKPGTLFGPNKAPLYSLFFAVSNPNERAIKLAGKIARSLLQKI